MKKLILAFIMAFSLPAIAGTDTGGGGHAIIDANGKMQALDEYEGGISKGFHLEQVCPKESISPLKMEGKIGEIYKTAISKINILKQDPSYKVWAMSMDKTISGMQWFKCAKSLPNISDHRFINVIVNGTILQVALQNSRSQVIFSEPLINKMLSDADGWRIFETTFIHEITLNALGFSTERNDIAAVVNGFSEQNTKNLQLFRNKYDYLIIELNVNLNKHYYTNTVPRLHDLFVHLENGEVHYLENNTWVSGTSKFDLSTDRYRVSIPIADKGFFGTKNKNIKRNKRTGYYDWTFNSKVKKLCMNNIFYMYIRGFKPLGVSNESGIIGKTIETANVGISVYQPPGFAPFPINPLVKIEGVVPFVKSKKYFLQKEICLDTDLIL